MRATLSMSLPPFGPVPVRTSLRTRSGCLTTSAWAMKPPREKERSEEHTSELQSLTNLVCRLLLEKKKMLCTLYGIKKNVSGSLGSTIKTLLEEGLIFGITQIRPWEHKELRVFICCHL